MVLENKTNRKHALAAVLNQRYISERAGELLQTHELRPHYPENVDSIHPRWGFPPVFY